MASKRKKSRTGCPPALLIFGLLLLFLHTTAPAPDSAADLPASDEPDVFPLPLVDLLPTSSESTAAAAPPIVIEQPSQPVFTPSPSDYQSTGTIYFKNETDYRIDMTSLLQKERPVSLGEDGVQVLIMHTHGTEAYTPSPGHAYVASGEYRTTDSSANMLHVGQAICDILNTRGISTIHSRTLNDYPAYSGSYNRALKDIQAYIKQYPTIQLVIDVHRDAIATGNTYYKTAADVDGKQTAQLMFVTGTDAGGLSHPNWLGNLTFQAQLHDMLNSAYPGIMRPISIRASRFNQHVRIGSMLLEVGACGNTLEEAVSAAGIFANTLADALLK